MLKKYKFLFLMGFSVFCVMGMKRAGEELIHPNKRQNNISLFSAAAIFDFKEFEKGVLLGADINQKKMGQPIFCYVLGKIDKLRKQNINSFLSTNNPNDYSIEKNNDAMTELYRCLKLLLSHQEFNINCVNRQGKPLVRACIFRNFEKIYNTSAEKALKSNDEAFILKDFLEKGTLLLGPDKTDGYTLLHYAVSSNDEVGTERTLKTAEMLIQYGTDIDCITSDGNTALHLCCNNVRMTLLLLAMDAQIDKVNEEGETAADISNDSWIINMLTNEIAIKEYRATIRKIIVKNICGDADVSYISQFITHQQVGRIFQNIQNSCPYTRAVLEYISGLTIIRDAANELMQPEDSSSIEDVEYED